MITRYIECTIQKKETNQKLAAWDFSTTIQRAFQHSELIHPKTVQVAIPKDSKDKIYVKIDFDDKKYNEQIKRESPTTITSLGKAPDIDETIDDSLEKGMRELRDYSHFTAFKSEPGKTRNKFDQINRKENKTTGKDHDQSSDHTHQKPLTRTKPLTRANLQDMLKEMSDPNYDSDNDSISSHNTLDSDDSLNYEDALEEPPTSTPFKK